MLVALALPVAALAANDPYVGDGKDQQWHLSRIRAIDAWSQAQGGGAIVAVIDTGVDLDHPDLKDRIRRDSAGNVVGRDYIDGGTPPADGHGHGTLVAGVVAATLGNGYGGAGVAPRASIMPIRVLNDQGEGSGANVDAAIRWAADRGAHVINLSLECSAGLLDGVVNSCRVFGGAADDAVKYAWSKGAVVVAAAGNSGGATDFRPDTPVLLVGATDRDDRIAGFSDRGRTDALVAPGVEIVSTWCRDPERPKEPCSGSHHSMGKASGTSFSAPQVAGAAALLRASGLSNVQTVERLRATARDLGPPGPDSTYGYGLLDVAAAVGASNAPAPAPTPAPKPAPAPKPKPTSPKPAPPPPPPATTPPGTPDSSPTASPTPSPTPSVPATPSPTAVPTDPVTGEPIMSGGENPVDDQSAARWGAALLLAATIVAHVVASRRPA